jgi:hypothetical protein
VHRLPQWAEGLNRPPARSLPLFKVWETLSVLQQMPLRCIDQYLRAGHPRNEHTQSPHRTCADMPALRIPQDPLLSLILLC